MCSNEPLSDRVGQPEEVSAVPVAPPALHRLGVGKAQDLILETDHFLVGEVDRKHLSRVMHSRIGPVQRQPHLVFASHLQIGHMRGHLQTEQCF